MRIEQLQHFLEVAKCNSLSQAAENLFIGKSTLSNSISSLENEFSKPLFMRTRRGTFLSPFGEEILPMAQAAVDSVESIYGISHRINPSILTCFIFIPILSVPFRRLLSFSNI